MTRKVKIAVTGGIGSGKSYVMKLLSEMGYPVFSCDEISHELWSEEAYLHALSASFPTCTVGGKIVKEKLSDLIFSDEGERKRLETISHPRIMERLIQKMDEHPISFAEVPLLFEGGYESLFDGVILIERDARERIASVMRRDGICEESVKKRILAQQSDEEREKRGAVVLKNDGTVSDLKEKLPSVLHTFGL